MNSFCFTPFLLLVAILCTTVNESPGTIPATDLPRTIRCKVERSIPELPGLVVTNVEGYELTDGILEVRVGPGDAQLGWDSRMIQGTLSISDGKLRLERIRPADSEIEATMQEINRRLRADTSSRQQRQFRKEGDTMPGFALYNQQGHLLLSDSLKGTWVVMNFAFTRCMMQEMCPAQTARMVELQHLAKEQGIEGLRQITITLDPDYDTPGILTQYAQAKGADTTTYQFLTGPEPAILDLLKQFGVIAYESKAIIDHTVTTLLFDPGGRIVLRKDGNRWNAQDFLDRIRQLQGSIEC